MGWTKEGRSYGTPAGRVWSATTILGFKDKPALVQWASNMAVDYLRGELLDHLHDDPEGRCYYHLDSGVMSGLLTEAKTAHRRALKEAGDIGTIVHQLIADHLCKREVVIPRGDEILNAFSLFLVWADTVELEPLVLERSVVSTRHEYGGTFDLIARGRFNPKWRKKRTYMIDTKTSKGIYDTFGPQVAAYSEAYREMVLGGHVFRDEGNNTGKINPKIDGEGIIRVGKTDANFEFVDVSKDHAKNLRKFLVLKDAYIAWNGRPK
jgi:hypothetical protein